MKTSHPARITLSTPHEVIAAVPHLLGFQPSDSLVVLALAGPRLTVTLRYDLPQPADIPAFSEHLVSCLAVNRADEVILVGYGSEQATPVLTGVRDHLAELLTIRDIFRVTAGRWWSLTCTDPRCCPPDGNPVDSDGTLAAAEFMVLGSAPLPGRDDVAATIAPVTGEQVALMRAAIRRAARQLPPGWQPASSRPGTSPRPPRSSPGQRRCPTTTRPACWSCWDRSGCVMRPGPSPTPATPGRRSTSGPTSPGAHPAGTRPRPPACSPTPPRA